MSEKTVVLQGINVTKEYPSGGHVVRALDGMSVAFCAGEFAAIAGPSGSGKSTFLHLAGCLDALTSGRMLLNNQDTAGLSKRDLALIRRKRLGFIFQAYNLIPVLSAFENVSFPLTLLGAGRAEVRERAFRALRDVGLEGLENRRPKEMSGGQQQRVAIARALVKKPALILADEPTANLDSKTAREILELMVGLNKTEGTTFIFSTHDRLVMDYARRLIILRDGRIEKDEAR